MVKNIPGLIFELAEEILGLHRHSLNPIKSIYKALVHQLKFGSSFLKTFVVTVLTDPVIFFLVSGILIWMYIEEIMSVVVP